MTRGLAALLLNTVDEVFVLGGALVELGEGYGLCTQSTQNPKIGS